MTDISKLCQYCLNEADMSEEICAVCGQDPNRVPERSSRCLPQYTILAGRYLIGRVLGEGGFGITYLALDLIREERVAVKEYFPVELASRDTKKTQDNEISIRSGEAAIHFNNGMRRFESEALTLRKLEMLPGIVSVLDFFTENNTAYLVMEYIEGGNLKNYLKNYIEKNGHAIPCEEAFGMMRPVLNSLQKVHEAGIIHRDISPENILLDKNGDLVLIDFGSAKTNLASRENRSMTVMVKHGYAPEEQYRTHGDQGPWTDIYAACATLYHMISGILPEDAIERLIGDRMKSLKELELTSPVPEGYSDIIGKGMQIRGKNRYQSVEEMLADIDAAEKTIAKERRRTEEEQRKAEEAARLEAERRAAEEARREEEKKKAEEARKLEAERRAAEEKKKREAERKTAQSERQKKSPDAQMIVPRKAVDKNNKHHGLTAVVIIAVLAAVILSVIISSVRTKNIRKSEQNKGPEVSATSTSSEEISQDEAKMEESAFALFPNAESFTKLPSINKDVISVLKAQNGEGYVISAGAKGYGGTVTAEVAVSGSGEIFNVVIDGSSEVSDLGKQISEPAFSNNFIGMKALQLAKEDVDIISGATVSSYAALEAVNLAVKEYNAWEKGEESLEKSSTEQEEELTEIPSDLLGKAEIMGLDPAGLSEKEILVMLGDEYLAQEQYLAAAIMYEKLGQKPGCEDYLELSLDLWRNFGACYSIHYRPQRLAAIKEDGTVKVISSSNPTGHSPTDTGYYKQVENWTDIVSVQFASDSWQLYGLKSDGTIEGTEFNCKRFGQLTDVIGLASVQKGYVAAVCADGKVYWDKEIDGEWQVLNPDDWYDIRYITGGNQSLIGIRKDGVILEAFYTENDENFVQAELVEIRDYMDETITKITNDGAVMILLNDQGEVHVMKDPIEQDGTTGFWMTDEDIQRVNAMNDIVNIENGIFLHENGYVDATGWAWNIANGWESVSDIVYGYGNPIFAILTDGTIKCYDPYLSEMDYGKDIFLKDCIEKGLTDQLGHGLDPMEIMEIYGIDYNEYINNNSNTSDMDLLHDAGLADALNWNGLRTRK